MTIEPIVFAAFIVGAAFGFVLNRMLRWLTDTRFRVSRWVVRRRRRAVPGGR